jgi:hypothetical protein
VTKLEEMQEELVLRQTASQTASLPVCLSVLVSDTDLDFYYCHRIADLLMWGAHYG